MCIRDSRGAVPRRQPWLQTTRPPERRTLQSRHRQGLGDLKGKQGEYHDALFNKNNRVEIVLHEHLGGGFSPPAAQKMRRNGRKAKDHGVDRTPYQGDRKISYVSYHTRAISMGITKAESRTLIDAAHHAKGRLCRMRVGAPAALA